MFIISYLLTFFCFVVPMWQSRKQQVGEKPLLARSTFIQVINLIGLSTTIYIVLWYVLLLHIYFLLHCLIIWKGRPGAVVRAISLSHQVVGSKYWVSGLPRFFPSPDPTHVWASGTRSTLHCLIIWPFTIWFCRQPVILYGGTLMLNKLYQQKGYA